jgi:hypothetical protein
MKSLDKLQILDITSFLSEDDWYSYLINDYIPNKRPQDMGLFIDLGFNPINYICFRLAKEGHLDHKPELRDAILEKIGKLFNIKETP